VQFYSHASDIPNITQSAGAAQADANHNPVSGASHSMDAIQTIHTNGVQPIANGWGADNVHSEDVPMDLSSPHAPMPPHMHSSSSPVSHPMDITLTTPAIHDEHAQQAALQKHGLAQSSNIPPSGSKLRLGLGFGKKHSKWGLGGMFGHGDKGQQNVLPPVDELNVTSSTSTPSLKRTQSSSTGDSRSLSELSPVIEQSEMHLPPMDAKMRKKEAERVEMEAEIARRAQAQKRIRDQSRAVMQKREQLTKLNKPGAEVDWESSNSASLLGIHKAKTKQRAGAPAGSSSATINAAGGRFRGASDGFTAVEYDNWREAEHRTKARRREFDDDHSMSSSDVQSIGRLSVISFATVESDPSSSRMRHRPSMFGINRMQSASSLRTSFGDDFPASARSSHSPSLEQQLANDFDSRASFSSYDPVRSSFSDCSSPPPMQMLSLGSQPRPTRQTFITLPPVNSMQPPSMVGSSTPSSPYEYGQYGQIQAQPPSPAIAPHSAINPIFKVVSSDIAMLSF
jgi:meiosis induction protein kinase IME2/SME1